MIELYKARVALYEALETKDFSAINNKMLNHIAEMCLTVLGVDRSEINKELIEKKIIQSSRALYIGTEVSNDRSEAKEDSGQVLLDLITKTNSNKVSIERINVEHSDGEQKFTLTLRHTETKTMMDFILSINRFSGIWGGPAELSVKAHILKNRKSISVIDKTENDYVVPSFENLLTYWYSTKESGIQFMFGQWQVNKFTEAQTYLCIKEILTDQSYEEFDEGDWESLSQIVADDVMVLELSDYMTFKQSITALPMMRYFWDNCYEYSAEGHNFGQSVAFALLRSALIQAETEDQINELARAFVENVDAEIGSLTAAECALEDCVYFGIGEFSDISVQCLETRKKFLSQVESVIDELDGECW
ncbi:hypothetical protein OH460_08070 [Vibrio sp. Makdt]|uniref:hypothetical protein n=1 Tax=Vibrio sp. Makdt TaxID=2998828 RepID=UPI0022CD9BF2|nr:hypothetical protein [Vibrio sp. Makdt]MDA0152254.1 hypothetical protein [Vibrio sp. Makdt]